MRNISEVNYITQLIGRDATSFLMLECSEKGVAEGPVHFNAGAGFPCFLIVTCDFHLTGRISSAI